MKCSPIRDSIVLMSLMLAGQVMFYSMSDMNYDSIYSLDQEIVPTRWYLIGLSLLPTLATSFGLVLFFNKVDLKLTRRFADLRYIAILYILPPLCVYGGTCLLLSIIIAVATWLKYVDDLSLLWVIITFLLLPLYVLGWWLLSSLFGILFLVKALPFCMASLSVYIIYLYDRGVYIEKRT